MTWKDGGDTITNKDGSRIICTVWTKQAIPSADWDVVKSWPEGESNFHLILNAPKTLEALEKIAEGAIVSSDQSPEQIAEQALRALQIAREAAAKYMIYAGKQQQRAERAEEALKAIADLGNWIEESDVVRDRMEAIARAAMAAAKGENNDLES